MEIIIKEGLRNPPNSKIVRNHRCPQESIVEKLFNFKSEQKNPWYQTAADIFVILYLTGMDPADLLMLKGENWKGDEIIIIRRQSTSYSSIKIEVTEESSNRIMKYANKNITADGYIFPFIDTDLEEYDRSKKIQSFIITLNRYLGKIAEELQIEKFTWCDAKRTWIQQQIKSSLK